MSRSASRSGTESPIGFSLLRTRAGQADAWSALAASSGSSDGPSVCSASPEASAQQFVEVEVGKTLGFAKQPFFDIGKDVMLPGQAHLLLVEVGFAGLAGSA